jgi:Na+/proline symporter
MHVLSGRSQWSAVHPACETVRKSGHLGILLTLSTCPSYAAFRRSGHVGISLMLSACPRQRFPKDRDSAILARCVLESLRFRRRQLNPLVLGIAAYILLQFAIGLWVSRKIRTEDDYLVAGRSLGPGLTTFTVFATWFGAETCVSAAGLAYASGLMGASAEPFGYGLCIVVLGLFLAVPLWRMRLSTPADFFRFRYSPSVERLAVVLMVPTSLFWAAAQVRAFGHVLSAASGLEVELTIAVAAVVVIVYTAVGGLLAVAWTDLVQGIALIVGLIVLAVAVIFALGPETFAAIPPERLRLFGGGERSFLETLEVWAIPVLGSLTAAELITRVIAARSPEVARGATLAGGGAYLMVGLIPVAMGLVAGVAMPGLTEPEQVLPILAQTYLPPVLYALFAGALVSAILSTVDSALLVSGSLVSHNLMVPLLPGLSERGKVRLARGSVAVFGVVAYAMAVRADAVYDLVETASAFGSAGIVTVVVMGVFTRFGGTGAAVAALLSGVTAWILGAYVLELPYPYLGSLLAAAASYAVGGLVWPARPSPVSQQTGPAPLP